MGPYGRLDPAALRDVIAESGVAFKQNQTSYKFQCPACGKAEKLYVRKRDGRYVCWYCRSVNNTQGRRPEYVLAQLFNCRAEEIAQRIYDGLPADSSPLLLDIHLEGDDYDPDDFQYEEPLIDAPALAWEHDYHPIEAPESAAGASYLAGRGIPAAIAASYGVRYCPRRRSVSFPVAYEGVLYGHQDRLIISNEWWDEEAGEMVSVPKIRSRKAADERSWRERTLMFMDRLRDTSFSHAVVCEGPIDAIKAHLCGGNVALMGKSFSPAQIGLLRTLGVPKVYLGLDPDAAEEMTALVRELHGDAECYLMEVPEGQEDFGAMSFEAVLEAFRSARRVDPTRLFFHLRG